MNLDEWDAPYGSPLCGCMMLIGRVALFVLLLVAFLLVRGLVASAFH